MKRVVAVVAGYVAWTILWLAGNSLFFAEAAEVVKGGEPYTETGPLAAIVGLSVACSLVAGYLCARIAGTSPGRVVVILGVLLLVTGIGVQASAWQLMPVWYHVTFLALLVPVTLVGGQIGSR